MQWMVLVWVLVAFLEEIIYRGFLIGETVKFLGVGWVGLTVNILFSALVFGLSHGNQNRCGMLSTGIIGAFIGIIFIFTDFNLWLVIFTHGFIDTIGIGLIALGLDKKLQLKIRGEIPT